MWEGIVLTCYASTGNKIMPGEGVVIMNCIMCGSVHPDNYPSTAAEKLAHNAATMANNDRKRGILNRDMEGRIKAKVKASGISQSWIDKNLKSLHVEAE